MGKPTTAVSDWSSCMLTGTHPFITPSQNPFLWMHKDASLILVVGGISYE